MALMSQRAGALRVPIEIQELVENQDSSGEPIKTYRRVANEWGAFTSVISPEAFLADRTIGRELYNVELRYLSWFTVKHRIVANGKNYDVVSLAQVPGNPWMQVLIELKE